MKRQHRGKRSRRGHLNQVVHRIKTIIRGSTFFDRDKQETIATQHGSVKVEDRFRWTDPGEVLHDPYGRGTLDTIR